MKYTLEMPDEIGHCSDCDYDSFDEKDNRHYCAICPSINLREINTLAGIHDKCPLKPLKAKELEWRHNYDTNNDVWTALYGNYLIYPTILEIYIVKIIDGKSCEFSTLEQAKEYCQEKHNNFIFSQLEV